MLQLLQLVINCLQIILQMQEILLVELVRP